MIERQTILNAISMSADGDSRLLGDVATRLSQGEQVETDLTRMDPALLMAALERVGIRTLETPRSNRILAHVDHLNASIDPTALRAWEQSGDPVPQGVAVDFVRMRQAVKSDIEAIGRLFTELIEMPESAGPGSYGAEGANDGPAD